MRQHKTFFLPVGGRLIALGTIALFAAGFFSYQQFPAIEVVEAQARRRPRKVQSRRATPARAAVSLSTSFNHEHHRPPHPLKFKLDCAYCHTIPTQRDPDVFSAAKHSTKGYPYHDSCLDCHRSQKAPLFFRGANPTICTVCHTRSSPRLTPRDMSRFPKHNEQAMERGFPGYFPHDIDQHQEKSVKCIACHKKDEPADAAIARDGGEKPSKPEGTFKTSPSDHATCFQQCHWQKDKPGVSFFSAGAAGLRVDDGCAGCHLTPPKIAKEPRNQLSEKAKEWFKNWPREWPKRLSLKFNHDSHEREDHQKPDCTDCHTNLAEMNTLDILKAAVKITACATCHFRKPPNIGQEMTEEDTVDTKEGRNINPASKDGKHTCTGCHTNEIGSAPTPCSHYLLPDKYLDLEEYSDNARQIAKQCKEVKK